MTGYDDSIRSAPFEGLGPMGEALLHIGGQDAGVAYDEVRKAMNDWAHELANKQREGIAEIMEEWGGSLHQDMLGELIDLIDPEAKR